MLLPAPAHNAPSGSICPERDPGSRPPGPSVVPFFGRILAQLAPPGFLDSADLLQLPLAAVACTHRPAEPQPVPGARCSRPIAAGTRRRPHVAAWPRTASSAACQRRSRPIAQETIAPPLSRCRIPGSAASVRADSPPCASRQHSSEGEPRLARKGPRPRGSRLMGLWRAGPPPSLSVARAGAPNASASAPPRDPLAALPLPPPLRRWRPKTWPSP
jgi:hypothetical protein